MSSIYDDALAPLGINIAQYSLLRMIARRQPISFTELGRIAELDRSTVGRNVRVLERMKLVATTRSANDHRESVTALTKHGAEVLDEAVPLWASSQQKVESRLGSTAIKALKGVLKSI